MYFTATYSICDHLTAHLSSQISFKTLFSGQIGLKQLFVHFYSSYVEEAGTFLVWQAQQTNTE